jgi:metallophosphoesterase superfamily enzyme
MDATLRDRAVLLGDTLVCADLHVGKGAASNVELPLGERDHLLDRLGALLDRYDPETVVVAGDFLHSFDRVPSDVQETVRALSGRIREAGARLVVTPGNHDAMLDTVWQGPTEAEHVLSGVPDVVEAVGTHEGTPASGEEDRRTVVCHGHTEPAADADCYVIGHDHPAITVEGKKWHCYLYAADAYRGAAVLVLPAFTHLAGGVSINRRRGTADLTSPLVADLDRFQPIVRDEEADETRAFPPLGEFRELL